MMTDHARGVVSRPLLTSHPAANAPLARGGLNGPAEPVVFAGRPRHTGGKTMLDRADTTGTIAIAAGTPGRARLVDDNQVRAAAGVTMALGAVAFAYANFEHTFWLIRTVTPLFALDFLIRVTAGLERSPAGMLAGWMTRHRAPQWASARPKVFAWSLGLGMTGAMAAITNDGIHGALPRSICIVCLSLMWSEAVLGFCLGCAIYGWLARRGLLPNDDGTVVCASGACARRDAPGQTG